MNNYNDWSKCCHLNNPSFYICLAFIFISEDGELTTILCWMCNPLIETYRKDVVGNVLTNVGQVRDLKKNHQAGI